MIRNSMAYRRMYYMRKRNARTLHIYLIFLFLIVVLGALGVYANKMLSPYLVEVSENKARAIVAETVGEVISEEFGRNIKYTDLVIIERDNGNRITSIQVDVARLNILAARMSEKIPQRLTDMKRENIPIPLGVLLGNSIFSAEGPALNIKVIPSGSVEADFKSEFSSAGVNQTRHQIFLQVRSQVRIAIPVLGGKTQFNTSILLAETIIVGNVPDSYMNMWDRTGKNQ